MDADHISSSRKTIVERLAQVPDDSIPAVLAFVDDLIEQHRRSVAVQDCEELTPPEAITTWEQWFREVDKLSACAVLITKQIPSNQGFRLDFSVINFA